jgi:hypothetical protein
MLLVGLFPKLPTPMAFYIGWIPANLIACFYFGLTVNFLDAFFILFFCQVVQLVFVYTMQVAINWISGKRMN